MLIYLRYIHRYEAFQAHMWPYLFLTIVNFFSAKQLSLTFKKAFVIFLHTKTVI
jgi:hypothetical protein